MIHLDQLVIHQLDQTQQQRDHLQFNDQALELHPLFVFNHDDVLRSSVEVVFRD